VSAEEEAKPAGPEPSSAKPSKLVLLLLVLNLGASGSAVFRLLTVSPAAAAGAVHAEPPPSPTAEVTGPTLALEPFVVNLDEPGSARYLRVKLQFELASNEAEAAITKSMLLVRDVILGHLSGLKLVDTLGTQAKEKVREELVKKLEASFGPGKIRRMFFTEWVVQ
jgi:flagellar FliL protein